MFGSLGIVKFLAPIIPEEPYVSDPFLGKAWINLFVEVEGASLQFHKGLLISIHTTRWAPTSYKCDYNPCKWPYNWVTGVITPLVTGRGPPCTTIPWFWTCHVPPPRKGYKRKTLHVGYCITGSLGLFPNRRMFVGPFTGTIAGSCRV